MRNGKTRKDFVNVGFMVMRFLPSMTRTIKLHLGCADAKGFNLHSDAINKDLYVCTSWETDCKRGMIRNLLAFAYSTCKIGRQADNPHLFSCRTFEEAVSLSFFSRAGHLYLKQFGTEMPPMLFHQVADETFMCKSWARIKELMDRKKRPYK